MSSTYFNAATYAVTGAVLARADDVNDPLQAIDSGFQMLPEPTELKRGTVNIGVDSGAAGAYVVAMTYTETAYTDGMLVAFKADNDNTGASTINVDSLGVKSITRMHGAALVAGDIKAGYWCVLRYNSTSGKFEHACLVAGEVADIATLAAISSEIAAVAAIDSEIVTLEGISANIVTVAGIYGDVSTLAGISADVTTVAGISANVTTVAGITANIATVVGIAADITTVAGISANVTTLAGIDSDITTVSGISADVTTVAGDSADVSTVAGISSDVSAVASMVVGWSYDSSNSMADPGSADLRLNNSSPASATAMAISATSDAGDVSDYIAAWDTSSSAAKGHILIRKGGAPGTFAIFSVTGAVVDNSTWLQIPLSYVDGNGSFSNGDQLWVSFHPKGDAGDMTGPASSVDGNLPSFDGVSGTSVQDSGIAAADVIAMRQFLAGGGELLGWDFEAQDSDGSTPPSTPETPDQFVFAYGAERVKAELTYNASDDVTVAVYSYSTNSGSSYSTLGTLTITYDASNNPLSSAWS